MPRTAKPRSRRKTSEIRVRVEDDLKDSVRGLADAEFLDESDFIRRELRRIVRANAHKLVLG